MQILSNPNILDRNLNDLETLVVLGIDNEYRRVLGGLFLSNAGDLNKLTSNSKDKEGWADSFARSKEIKGLKVFIQNAFSYLWSSSLALGTEDASKEINKSTEILDFSGNLQNLLEFNRRNWSKDELEIGRLSEALTNDLALETYIVSEGINRKTSIDNIKKEIQKKLEKKLNPYLKSSGVAFEDLDEPRKNLILANLSDTTLSNDPNTKLENVRQLAAGYKKDRVSKKTNSTNETQRTTKNKLLRNFKSAKYLYDQGDISDTTITDTETRERLRTLANNYPEFKNPIWQNYLDKRTETVANTLSSHYQNKIKQETLSFINSRDINAMQNYLDSNLRGTQIPAKEYAKIREEIAQLTFSRKLSEQSLKDLYRKRIQDKDLKLSKNIISRINKFEKTSTAQNYVKNLKLIRKQSRDDIIREIKDLQERSKVPYTGELKSSYQKQLEDIIGKKKQNLSKEDLREVELARESIRDYDDQIKNLRNQLNNTNLSNQQKKNLQQELETLSQDRAIEQEDLNSLLSKASTKETEGLLSKALSKNKNLLKKRVDFLTNKSLLSNDEKNELKKIDLEISNSNKELQKLRQDRDTARNQLQKLDKEIEGSRVRPESSKKISIPSALQKKIKKLLGKESIPEEGKVTWQQLDNYKTQVRNNEFWENEDDITRRIGVTEISAAYNLGRMATFLNDPDIEYFQWVSILDSRTSVFCQRLNGRVFHREDFSNLVMQNVFPNTELPDYHPNNITKAPGYSKFGGYPVWFPPAHPYCRSYMQPIRSRKKNQELKSSLADLGLELEGKDISQEKAERKRNRQRTAVRNLTSKLAALASGLVTADRLFNSAYDLILRRYKSSRKETKEEDPEEIKTSINALETALLASTAVLSGGALYYFFFKSNLDEKLKLYLQDLASTVGTTSASQTVLDLLNRFRKNQVPSLPISVEEKLKKRLDRMVSLPELRDILEPQLELQRNADRIKRLQALLGDPELNLAELPSLLSGSRDLPREVTQRLYRDSLDAFTDVIKDLETKGQRALSKAINTTSKAELKGSITLYYDPRTNRYSARTSTGGNSFISRNFLEDPDFKIAKADIINEANILYDHLRELNDLVENLDVSAKRDIQTKLLALKRLTRFGTYSIQEKNLSPKSLGTSAKAQAKIDNYISLIEGEIDSLRRIKDDNIEFIRGILNKNYISESQLNSILRSLDLLPRDALTEIRRRILISLEEIQDQFIKKNSRDILKDIKDPFKGIEGLTIDSNIQRLQNLNVNPGVGSSEKIIESLRQDYFNEFQEELQRLLNANRIIEERLKNL